MLEKSRMAFVFVDSIFFLHNFCSCELYPPSRFNMSSWQKLNKLGYWRKNEECKSGLELSKSRSRVNEWDYNEIEEWNLKWGALHPNFLAGSNSQCKIGQIKMSIFTSTTTWKFLNQIFSFMAPGYIMYKSATQVPHQAPFMTSLLLLRWLHMYIYLSSSYLLPKYKLTLCFFLCVHRCSRPNKRSWLRSV